VENIIFILIATRAAEEFSVACSMLFWDSTQPFYNV